MSNHEDLTGTLNRELEERAHAMDGSTLHLADVQGRARSIRRRRTAGAVAGVAAAVALIVPTAMLATHSNGRPEPAPPVATQTPSPSDPTRTATIDGHQPAPGVLDVSDLPTGAPPAMDYVQDGQLHLTEGSTGDVRTHYTPESFVEMADGARVWQTVDNNSQRYIEIQDADGTFHDPIRSRDGLSVNSPHSIVAWLTPSGQVTIWEGWASQPRPLGDPITGSDLRLGPVTGSGGAVEGQAGPDCQASGCTVIVNVNDPGAMQPWEVSDHFTRAFTDGGDLLSVNDIGGSLIIGYNKLKASGWCSTLVGGGEFQGFETCQDKLMSFSPDGRTIVAEPSQGDGAGPTGIAMYGLDGGRPLFERSATEAAQSYYTEATWEDATMVLAPTFQDGSWSLVRIAADGSMEYAVPPAQGDFDHSPFILPTGGGLPGA